MNLKYSFPSAGTLIAIALSWATNHSFWWMIWHAMCSWLYVVYWGFKHSNLEALIKELMK